MHVSRAAPEHTTDSSDIVARHVCFSFFLVPVYSDLCFGARISDDLRAFLVNEESA